MAVQNRSTIKSWFQTGLKPTQQQFWDWLDSFRHKSDPIAISEVQGLETALGSAGGGSGGSANATIELWLSRRVSDKFVIDASTAGPTVTLSETPDLRDLQIFRNQSANFFDANSDVTVNGKVLNFNFRDLKAGEVVRAIYTKVVE